MYSKWDNLNRRLREVKMWRSWVEMGEGSEVEIGDGSGDGERGAKWRRRM